MNSCQLSESGVEKFSIVRIGSRLASIVIVAHALLLKEIGCGRDPTEGEEKTWREQ
jgi:hypothetical protein